MSVGMHHAATFSYFCCECLQRRKHMLLSSAAGEIDVQKE